MNLWHGGNRGGAVSRLINLLCPVCLRGEPRSYALAPLHGSGTGVLGRTTSEPPEAPYERLDNEKCIKPTGETSVDASWF